MDRQPGRVAASGTYLLQGRIRCKPASVYGMRSSIVTILDAFLAGHMTSSATRHPLRTRLCLPLAVMLICASIAPVAAQTAA
ncbi:hypothetical protein ABTK52_18435, partial [Acinetobacter baumannii]